MLTDPGGGQTNESKFKIHVYEMADLAEHERVVVYKTTLDLLSKSFKDL